MGRVYGKKKPTISGGASGRSTGASGASGSRDKDEEEPEYRGTSFHRSNFHLFSQPVILTFNLFRMIAFYIWLILSTLCNFTVQSWPTRHRCITQEVQADSSTMVEAEAQTQTKTSSVSQYSLDYPATSSGGIRRSRDMSRDSPRISTSMTFQYPPLEPIISRQKHHHRKAFEYISRALKLDNEDRSGFFF